MEEFAYDIWKIGEGGKTYAGKGTRFSDYFGYGAPVLASADGEVLETIEDVREDTAAMRGPEETQESYLKRVLQDQAKRLAEGVRGIVGNTIIIGHGNGEFSIYSHLKPGSVRVKKGQRVKAGDEIAALGSSGNSTEPHLHFQVSDAPKALNAVGIPPQFVGVEIPMEFAPRALQTGDPVIAK
jgi:murein DD-endopeptidase MepM/ murein hydrolase activator NlpD